MPRHPTAIIAEGARIPDSASIGPYCIIGPNVELGEEIVLHSHVVVDGHTVIGPHSTLYPFVSIGTQPQDLKYGGEASTLTIGAHVIIREHVTMNPGTEGGGMKTTVGDHCLFMVGSHVAHDCHIGDHVIMANNATLAGHVTVGDFAIIGGLSAIHQFVRIGHHAMVGGMSGVENDVVPYGSATGDRATLAGLNLVGLKRREFSRKDIHDLRGAYRMLFSTEGTLEERLTDVVEHFNDTDVVMEIVDFIRTDSSRALCQPRALKAA